MLEARYSRLCVLFLSGMVATAQAQTLPAGESPPPSVSPGPDSAGSLPPPSAATTTADPGALPAPSPATPFESSVAPPLPFRSVVPQLDPLVHSRYRAGRVVYGVGTAVSFVGSGLTLASVIVSAVYGLGLDQSEGQITGRIGPGLAYAGSSSTGAGFVMVATGLGLQHSALALAGQDPGRGMYAAGTALGILGLCGIGTSYFFGLTSYGGENSTVIAFGSSIAAGTLLTISSLLFFSDATRVRSVYRRLTTF